MKFFRVIFILLFFNSTLSATIYTFHSPGDYQNIDNWDIYPGNYLNTNDTISIEAYCYGFNLFANDGYIVFSEDLFEIGIDWFTIEGNCQVEFLSDYMSIDIGGSISFSSNNYIQTPIYSFYNIYNYGFGFETSSCSIWENYVEIIYANWGTQYSLFLECMNGTFINNGNIEVGFQWLDVNCDLDLSSGTITGTQPFAIIPYNGIIFQNCNSCTATINNITTFHISQNSTFKGQVILNPPQE